jgi:hypothetical protein
MYIERDVVPVLVLRWHGDLSPITFSVRFHTFTEFLQAFTTEYLAAQSLIPVLFFKRIR